MSAPEFDLLHIKLPPETINQMMVGLARQNKVVPVSADGPDLVVAMAKYNQETVEKLTFVLAREISVVLASAEAIEIALDKYYPLKDLGKR